MSRKINFSDLPKIITENPFGLMIAVVLLGFIFIYRGVFGCLTKIMIRLPFNLQTPNKILEGDICNPDKMFQVRLGEGILNMFKHQWFVYLIIIIGLIIFMYFKFIKDR